MLNGGGGVLCGPEFNGVHPAIQPKKSKLRKRLCSFQESLFHTGFATFAKKRRLKSCDSNAQPAAAAPTTLSRPASSLGSAWSIAGCGVGVGAATSHCDSALLSDRLGVLVAGDVPKNLYRHNLAFIVASSRLYCNRQEDYQDLGRLKYPGRVSVLRSRNRLEIEPWKCALRLSELFDKPF